MGNKFRNVGSKMLPVAPSYPSTPPSDRDESEDIWQQLTDRALRKNLFSCGIVSKRVRASIILWKDNTGADVNQMASSPGGRGGRNNNKQGPHMEDPTVPLEDITTASSTAWFTRRRKSWKSWLVTRLSRIARAVNSRFVKSTVGMDKLRPTGVFNPTRRKMDNYTTEKRISMTNESNNVEVHKSDPEGSPVKRERSHDSQSEYEPFKERRVENATTNWGTLFNFVKCVLGTGILAMPNAFYYSGYAIGIAGMVLVSFVVIYCKHMLTLPAKSLPMLCFCPQLKCSYYHCKKKRVPLLTFEDTVVAAFAEGPLPFKKCAPYMRQDGVYGLLVQHVLRPTTRCPQIASRSKINSDRIRKGVQQFPRESKWGSRYLRPTPFYAHALLGQRLSSAVRVTICVYMTGVLVVYTVFIGANLKAVCSEYVEEIDERLYMLMALPVIILINCVRDLKFLVPFSVVANTLAIVSLGIVLYYVFVDLDTLDRIEPVGELANMPLFFATAVFALEPVTYLLTFQHKMKYPQAYGGMFGVLNQGLVSLTVLYIAMGFFGYMKYGSDIESSITLNLPGEEPLAQSVRIMQCLAIVVTHVLHNIVTVNIVCDNYLAKIIKRYRLLVEYTIRIGPSPKPLPICLAVAVPKLDLFISLLGALGLSLLGIVLPALVEMSDQWYQVDRSHLPAMVAKNLFIALLGLLALITGTYSSLLNIVNYFQGL
uniref:Amino acid transporter transmembrane domain-containing protein n=1 Tax=Timema douglasi TaxID=61478 RepID=A0A7R8VNJ4_TIMDO|nr:unnamed protein product [Timema douglasi]